MAVDEEFGRRARIALAQLDNPPQMKEIAERVRAALGRDTLTPQAVGGWFRGQEPESFRVTAAFADVLQVDAGWLAFGDRATGHSSEVNAEEYPQPTVTPLLRPATEAEAQRLEDEIHGAKREKKRANGGRRRPS